MRRCVEQNRDEVMVRRGSWVVLAAFVFWGCLAIQRAAHSFGATIEDVSINLCRFNVLVAEEFLHSADIVAGFQEMGGEAVAEGVGCGRFGDAAGLDRGADSALQIGVVGVVAAGNAAARIDAEFGGREDILPAPFAIRIGVFAV